MRRFSMLVVCLGFSSIAFADGTVVATTTPAPDPATASAAPPMAATDDGMRLRNGFSLSASHEFGSGPSSGFSGQLFGADWRIGAAIDDLHAVYLQSHISFGNAKIGNAEGVTGNLAIALMGERLLPQRIFVAGGGGYGVLNNPNGPLAQARVGWYPTEADANGKSRRLNVALDARWYFPGEEIGTVTQLALTIGYDRF